MNDVLDLSQTNLPRPWPLPLLGSKLHLARFFQDPISSLLTLYRDHGSTVLLSERRPAIVCAFGAENNRQILTDTETFHNYSTSLVKTPPNSAASRLPFWMPALNGEAHRRRRRLVMPLFSRSTVEGYRDIMATLGERLISEWRVGQTVNLTGEMVRITLPVFLRCVYGLEFTKDAVPIAHLAMDFLDGMGSLPAILLPFNVPGLPYHHFLRTCELLEKEIQGFIRERRENPTNASNDLLSLLLQSRDEEGNALSEPEVVAEVNGLFVAGHETTANTLAWTLFLLAQHPRVHADLLDELTSVLHGDAPTVEQLNQLPLLDAVVKESMRLLPAIPLLFLRKTSRDVALGRHTLPEGTTVALSPLVSHHAPDVFPEPRRFRPERWSTLKPSPYEYMPFGAGPRLCVGTAFSMLELRILLALIVQRYRLALVPGTVMNPKVRSVVMGLSRDIAVRVVRQDRNFEPPMRVEGTIRNLVDLS
ncbi:cytochrome P450 [Polyangium sp. 15x6]|uniref:cytochrome P450 n=1 Tax=Polyangium sp. 15x6 TaxID=3042687 RepID=UPI00249A4947|nr:cytochrome P450 [Polyangium sp. 15x6]MDI3287053.1 cytochrome P450 [Polyangium sp. 15x6]